ncbi:MAG: hypothetical protein SGI91_04440 [Alphaproteobacteria bacterium]|jgi:hypothetical protein|nr:hypothetical protein [Alphaproteobacteria bacterium]
MRSVILQTVFAIGALALVSAAPDDAGARSSRDTMKCAPKTVNQHSTLKITLPYPHGPYLAVYDKHNNPGTFIVYPHPAVELMISPEAFPQMKEVEFNVGEIKGHDGAKFAPVFVQPGRYRILVAWDLETGASTVDGECSVSYSPLPR